MGDQPTYSGYLDLGTVLSAQRPLSGEHDELLFIVIHQAKELWLKQIVAELKLAKQLVRADRLIEVHKILSRVSRIQSVLTASWDILTTMTPADYVRFRHVLGTSSGFQSAQFREMEFLLGLKDIRHVDVPGQLPEERRALNTAFTEPSLWDEANAALARAGLLDRPEVADGGSPEQQDAVVAAWLEIYRDPQTQWPFYQLAEKLVDLDEGLSMWRYKHVLTVERVIGFKRGTGGTAGAAYLQTTLRKRAFPELWEVRSRL